ncbi:MAG TPA: HipA N-terminal domain-containing protein [Mucilaginibacter sp.]
MLNLIKRWFNKNGEDVKFHLPKNENATFILKVDKLEIGTLHCENGVWEFKYTEEFKTRPEYNRITEFSDLNKVYRNDTLWPFFQTRIPGLKQPAVMEILKKENIDVENEYQLLKRFGKKTISNPYQLEPV